MQLADTVAPLLTPDLEPHEVPREALWRHYQAQAAGSAEAARLMAEEALAILRGERGDDPDALARYIDALGVAHQHLVAAARGLDAVRFSLGTA